MSSTKRKKVNSYYKDIKKHISSYNSTTTNTNTDTTITNTNTNTTTTITNTNTITHESDSNNSLHVNKSSLGLNNRRRREDGLIFGRRNPNIISIDYGNTHPFEVLRRERIRKRRRKLLTPPSNDGNNDDGNEDEQEEKKQLWYTTNHEFWYDPSFDIDDYIQDDWYETDDFYDPTTMYNININDVTVENKFDYYNFRPIRIRFDTRYLYEEHDDDDLRTSSSWDVFKNEFIEFHVLPAAIQFWMKALMVYPTKRLFVDNQSCILGNPSHLAYGINNADLI